MTDAQSVHPEPRGTETSRRFVSVRAAGALHGLAMDDVREVIAVRPITRVFHAPDALAGVTSLRGEILPVVDLGVLLGAPRATHRGADARIVVVRESVGERRLCGLLVDALEGIRVEPPEGLAPTPTTLGVARTFVVGVLPAPPPCSVLDVPRLLGAEILTGLSGAAGLR